MIRWDFKRGFVGVCLMDGKRVHNLYTGNCPLVAVLESKNSYKVDFYFLDNRRDWYDKDFFIANKLSFIVTPKWYAQNKPLFSYLAKFCTITITPKIKRVYSLKEVAG